MGVTMRPLVVLAPLLLAVGCMSREAAPPLPPKPPAVERPARQSDPDHPLVKEARPAVEAVLADLLAGKYDDDSHYAPLARKLRGFTGWAITGQDADRDHPPTVTFDGTLTAPDGAAGFTVSLVKQQTGRWM